MTDMPSPRRVDGSGVDATAGLSLHRQLFLVLRDEIARGVLAVGDALPSQQALCEQFQVSRITVRRALTDLAQQGYIECRQGVGSFVVDNAFSLTEMHNMSLADTVQRTHLETDVTVIDREIAIPPAGIAARLNTAEPLLHIVRLRRARRTGEPLIVSDAWLPARLQDTLTDEALTAHALFDLLTIAGAAPMRMHFDVTAEIAGPRSAALMDVAIGSALLRVNRLSLVDDSAHNLVSVLLSPIRSRVLLPGPTDGDDGVSRLVITHDGALQMSPALDRSAERVNV